jgi:hypothetical protein
MFAFARFLMIFCVGVLATFAWQSYGGAAREAMASWSPHFVWLAPPVVPADAPPDQIAAISRDFAVVRQSVDELAASVSKLKTSASQPSSAVDPVRKRGAGR